MDIYSKEKRSEIMSQVRTKDTTAERRVRSLLHRNGFRFRLHRPDLPGTPDIALRKYTTVIFVHGCFWHGHRCKKGKRPKSNASFWDKKIDANRRRDRRVQRQLRALGWRVLIVWECQTKTLDSLEQRLLRQLHVGAE